MSELPDIEVRALTTSAEYSEAVRLQRQIWGFDELELLPARLFTVAASVGGQTFGAYHAGRMVGFLLAIPGLRSGKIYLHSHMLGVLEPYRDRGVGRRLKLRQREDARNRSIPLVEWTFDPLQIKNAHFNIERLGAVVRRYLLNQYGTTTSHLHGRLPTDRCVAEWWVGSARVEAILSGRPRVRPAVEARIEVPVTIEALRREDPGQARSIQQAISEQFLSHLASGLAVVGFERSERGGAFLLGPWESD